MPTTPEIFISYAWGEAREDIVNKLYDNLTGKGYNVIRDKVNLGYKGKIKAFMERIGAGKAVIVVLSKKYLESKYCMFEALQIQEHGDLEQRIFPIVLSDANIFDVLIRIQYSKYWENKIAELNKAIREMTDMSNLRSIQEELNQYSEIRRFIDEFMGIVGNMNVLTPEMHQEADFQYLIDALDELLKTDQTALTAPKDEEGNDDDVPPPPIKISLGLAQEIRDLVSNGRLEDALKTFKIKAPNTSVVEITSLEAELRDLKTQELMGTLDFGEQTKARNKIVYRFLKLLES